MRSHRNLKWWKVALVCIAISTSTVSEPAHALPVWERICGGFMAVFGGNTSQVAPRTLVALQERKYEPVSVNDAKFMDTIWNDLLAGHTGYLNTSNYKWPAQFASLLQAAFGFEPSIFKYGEQHGGNSGISEDGLVFETGQGDSFDKTSVRKTFGGSISVTVTPETAYVSFETDREENAKLKNLASALPQEQGLLRKLLSKSHRYKLEFGGDPIFANFMNKGGPHYRYVHEVKVPRNHLTAFMYELDRFHYQARPADQ